MSPPKPNKPSQQRKKQKGRKNLYGLYIAKSKKVLELLQPGCFVTLDNQPSDLPPFEVINCKGGRCWVRQQAWGQCVHWEVEHYRLKSA
ncbi:hypothetical protein [Prochlorococcus sp. MIT 1341]|uniref:hypothetical protein n=1 Tax=Prochlorococcus sp. MIT 1341 TaxID=3096221 RepID=UPI002A75D420|nr:hypothetical protein [Prochlorococcus sp. MIT 1341]